jgi:predicted P-loop ATPase
MNVANIEEYKLKLTHDGQVSIATGKSRFETNWKNKKILWSNLVAKLKNPVITPETYTEYKKFGKPEQDKIKDVGGFIGGNLTGGRRSSGSVATRQILTLDLDFAPADFFATLEMLADYSCCVYSTHKHCPEAPRYRLLIPLDREVTPDEYEAIARRVAYEIGIDYFDDTTYQASRLMYWPSVSADGVYFYDYIDFPFLKADKVLATYSDWTDTSYWPESSRAAGLRKKLAEKQGDPCLKQGLIGAFCRTYTVPEAIENFLSDAYVKCDMPNRYTFTGGSTAAGLVIYEDEKFAYSNHATDPASGKLCNAFDLVRLHKFSELDEEAAVDTSIIKLPSYKAMVELIQKDDATKVTIGQEKLDLAKEDFGEVVDNRAWLAKLEYDKRGELENSLSNLLLILRNDENLKSIVFNQLSDGMEIIGDVPWKHPSKFWRDADDAQLVSYVDLTYGTFSARNYEVAVTKITDDRSYHPIKGFLQDLPEWDGIERLDMLLIDYLGANDNEYVKAVTRKTLVGAIARVMHPGCKYDTMLVLNGPQGIGKSTLIAKLGGEWFSDSLHLSDTKDKTAAEKLQGYWILEIGELAGLRKAEVDTLKGFISKQNDIYRASFGRRATPHLRQCVFIGTTNAENGYLRDTTGNRRFWPVKVPGGGGKKVWGITSGELQQIWAEALYYWNAKESLYLSDKLSEMAWAEQREAMETDEREGFIREYLEMLLPDNWDSMNIYERRNYMNGDEFETDRTTGTVRRERVCIAEIWCECFGKDKGNLGRLESNTIAAIMAKMESWEKAEASMRFKLYGVAKGYIRV